jgi:hypothetical protein
VFVGPNGLGKYQRLEVRALMHESTCRSDFRIIPILLSGVTDFPDDDTLLLRTFAAVSVERDGHEGVLQKVIARLRVIFRL